MSKERCIAQGLTNSPAITSIDGSDGAFSASRIQGCARTKLVTPQLAGRFERGDPKVKVGLDFDGRGRFIDAGQRESQLTLSSDSSRTILVTPHLPRPSSNKVFLWSAEGLTAFRSSKGMVCQGRRTMPFIPFNPRAGLVTPLLGGNRQEGWLDHTANTTYPCPNGSGFCPTNAQIVVNLAAKGSEVMPKMQLETHEVQTVTKARKGGNGYAGLL